MNYFIITGGSKGLGKALAVELVKSVGNVVITIARTEPELPAQNASFFSFDLTRVGGISAFMESIFDTIPDSINSIYLINNAAMVSPMGPLGTCGEEDIVKHFNLNSLAPAILSASFIKRYKAYPFKKGIINISSGVSRNPYQGWGCYCSSKASLAMLTNCVALENPEFDVSVFDPGVLDTSMQEEIRSMPSDKFQTVEKFRSFKYEHRLLDPAEAAKNIISQYFNTLEQPS